MNKVSIVVCVSFGFLAACTAAVGHNIYICNSISDGIVFTVILPLILVFSPQALVAFLMAAGIGAVVTFWLTDRFPFAQRPWLLAGAVCLTFLAAGNWLAFLLRSSIVCSAGIWS